MTKQKQAMRLYQAIERLSLQAGEDVDEAVDWLCGESGGMFKLYQQYFSPKQPLTWVDLTELQLLGAYEAEQQGRWGDHVRGLLAIQAKLKDKNNA